MTPSPRNLALVLGFGALAVACAKVPYTGRKQYNLIPEKAMIGLGKTTYGSTLEGATIKKKGSDNEVLQRVGSRVSKVAKKKDYEWTYSLIEDDQLNAWCLPGGYIGFYTGILPALKHEAGMSFVMGHEVAHAIAKHGSERVSQQITVLGGLAGLYAILDGKTKMSTEQKALVVGALGVATEVGVVLPFSRMHESEADAIGLMYMAEAGYPPTEAGAVWDRMAANAGGAKVPAFLSTHPSNEKRKKTIDEWLPQARKKYTRNKLDRDTTNGLW